MPFDGGNFFEGGGNWPKTLNDVLKVLNIKPLSNDRLTYQKIREKSKYQPSFWYRYRRFFKSFLFGNSLVLFVSTFYFLDEMAMTVILAVLGYVSMMTVILVMPSGPPQWSEYRAHYLTPENRIPNHIIDKYDSIRKYLPSAMASVGKLRDCNDNVLASYVVVSHENTTAVIDFWR